MTAPTGRKVFFLTDPIEDRQKDWADYKANYQTTFTAQLYPNMKPLDPVYHKYIAEWVRNESINDKPFVLQCVYIDLFDPELPVVLKKTGSPGEQSYLYDVNKVADKNLQSVLCGASRVSGELLKTGTYSFTLKSPAETNNVSRVYLPVRPKEVAVTTPQGEKVEPVFDWDETFHTCRVKFENSPEGRRVMIEW